MGLTVPRAKSIYLPFSSEVSDMGTKSTMNPYPKTSDARTCFGDGGVKLSLLASTNAMCMCAALSTSTPSHRFPGHARCASPSKAIFGFPPMHKSASPKCRYVMYLSSVTFKPGSAPPKIRIL